MRDTNLPTADRPTARLVLRLARACSTPLLAAAGVLGAALLPAPQADAQNVSSVALSPASVAGGAGSTGTVTLSANAPAGGSLVTLASSKAQAVVPANVTVPAGTKVATFPVTTTAVTASTSASITATRGTSSKSATLTILPLLSSLTVGTASVVGGAAAPTGKVSLNGPAPVGGAAVALTSSSTSRATVPATVVVAEGATVATFPITTLAVASNGSTTLTASHAGVSKTASLQVTKTAACLAIVLDRPGAASGTTVGATVRLNGDAPAGGATVTLTSSNTTAATVPASVLVPAGARIATFVATAGTVAASTNVTLTAAIGGVSRTVTLPVTPATAILSVSLNPASVTAARLSTATIQLNGPAPAGGASVTLTSSRTSAATVPASTTIPAGSLTGTFTVTSKVVTATTSATISAAYAGTTKTASLQVSASSLALGVTFAASPVTGGAGTTATIRLNGPAPAGGAVVTLFSSATGVATVPSTVTVASGADSATAAVATSAVTFESEVAICASYGGALAAGTLVVAPGAPPVTLSTLSVAPTSVASGGSATGTVTLTGASPAGGSTLSLSSSSPSVATVPPSVTVPEGASTATFPVTAGSVSTDTGVTLTATLAAVSRTATLTVLAPPPTLSGVSVTPAVVFGGSPADGTVTLTGNAPAGGVTVSLASSHPSVASVPASVVVPQGAASAGFAVSTSPVTSDTVATVTATAGGTSREATLSVRRATAAPLDVDLAEGNATSWTGFALDGATTSVSDDLSLVASGASSLRFVTQSGLDTGVRYVFPGGAHWDLTAADFLSFQAFPVNPNPPGFQGAQPVVVLVGPAGSLRLTPSTVRSVAGAWRLHRVPLSADSEWTRSVEGTFSLADVVAIEIHQDTWDAGFTVNYDDVRFTSALPGDLTEANAARWEPYAEDGAAVSVADEAARVKVGSRALLFTTGSGFSTGIRYPLGGEPHWDLSAVESLSFWTWATNPSTFQGAQPVVYLHSPDGSYRYEPDTTLMTVDGWRYHEVPLSGDEVWTRTAIDEPSLSDVIAVEILHDTWDAGFTVVFDGVGFGRPLPELVLDTLSAEGGSHVTGSVRLGTPAPAGGRVVSLSSSDPAVASVPSTVTVSEGALSAPFTVTTEPVSYDRWVWVSFDDAGVSRASSLQVTPPLGVSALSLSPPTVVPGGTATGTVTLTRAAPAGGLTVALSASPAGAVTLSPSVAVPAGETWATFQVQVDAAATTSPVTITASYGTTTRTASLGLYQVSVLTVTPSSILAGSSATGTVTLSAAAPSGGLPVALSTTNGAVTIPASVTAASGSSTATFPVAASTVASPVTGTISAAVGPSSRSTSVEVVPFGIKSLGISPPLVGGVAKNGWVELTGPAGTGGVVVTLTSSDPAVLSLPASVTVPQGQTYTAVPATPAVVTQDTPVTMTASALGDQKSVSVTVVPLGLQGVTLGSSTIAAGHTTTVRVDLNAPAPTGGLEVTLSANGGGFQRTGQAGTYHASPVTIVVPAGQTTKTDTVLARWRGTPGTLDVTATTPATSRSASATVTAGTIGLGLTSPVRRGGSTTGTISISGWPWPPAGSSIVVGLSSSSPSFPVPVTVTATERTGSLSYSSRWDFALPVGTSVPDGTYTITATYEGVTAGAPLVVSPSGLTALTVNPSAAPQGGLVTGAVFLDAPAPAGGLGVALSSSNGAAASVPLSVLVPAGASSADFDVTPAAVAATTDVTLSATLDATTRTVPFRALKPGAGSFFGGVMDASVYDVLPPLSDVLVGLGDGSSQSATGPDGGFLFYSDPGTVDVTAARPGWVTASLPQRSVAAGQAVDLGAVPLRKVLSGGCQFTGRVVRPDNTPVEGASGVLEGYDATVTTTADGRYQFSGPNVGVFRFTFSKNGFPTRTEDVFTFLSYCGLPAQQAELYDFVLDPNPRPVLADVVVRTPVVIEGGSARLEPILTDPAPVGGASILISPVAPYPTSEPRLRATVPAGWRQGYSFEISQPAVASSTRKTYALHYGGVTKYVSFDLLAEALHVICSPYPVIGGQPLTCTLSLLSGAAPAGGLAVSLSSARGLLVPPPTATIPSGQAGVSVTVGTLAVGVTDSDDLMATSSLGAGSGHVVLHPLGVASLTLSASTIPGGSSVTGTVVLQAPAPSGGTSVGLGRSNAAVLIPATVTVPQGQASATFTVGTTTVASVTAVDLTAYLANPNAQRANASCQVTPDAFAPTGLAPATFLPGDSTPVLYGQGFDAATATRLYGPYTQYVDPGTGQTVPTCAEPCPYRPLSASLLASGAGVSFTVPSDVAPGIYDVRAEKAGVVSPALWALVEPPAVALSSPAEEERDLARPLLPGQTVTSTFPLRATPALGAISDYHFYWFFGTAGSRVDLSLERVDGSREWSHPESLDPRLEVIAPDGFVYENLASDDIAAGADFDAAVVDGELPLTGLYVVVAETGRGNGDYRLRLTVRSSAPALPADRLSYLTNVSASLPVGTRFDPGILATDPRGYPVGGTGVRLVSAPQPGDRGAFQFVGSDSAVLDVHGVASIPVRVTAAGKVSLKPEFVDAAFAALTSRPDALGREGAADTSAPPLVDRFQPVARWAVHAGLGANGTARVVPGAHRQVVAPRPAAQRREVWGREPAPKGRSATAAARDLAPAGAREPGARAVPLSRRPAEPHAACDAAPVNLNGVEGPLDAPFTVTLKDVTSGGSGSDVDPEKGLTGHRVEKTVRLKVDVRGGSGGVPGHPVLIRVTVGGYAHGKVRLPGGDFCDAITFLWHDTDGQGNPVPNDEIEYQLGTYSTFEGTEVKDGGKVPVWSPTETLLLEASAYEESGVESRNEIDVPVRPEPGKPDHFAAYEADWTPREDLYRYWAGYRVTAIGTRGDGSPLLLAAPHRVYGSYFLFDAHDNVTYGYTATGTASPLANLTVGFESQLELPFLDTQPTGYRLTTSWTNDPAWPQGDVPVPLFVDYPPDPDWPAGRVTKVFHYLFDVQPQRLVVKQPHYDLIRPDGSRGVDDTAVTEDGKVLQPFPIKVSPGAVTANLPKTSVGDVPRLVLLLVSGSQLPGDIPQPEPTTTGTRYWSRAVPPATVWKTEPDPVLDTGPATFRLSLVNGNGAPMADGEFRVHLCPRFAHEASGSGCSLPPVESSGGVIPALAVNTNGTSADRRGYLGVELTRAPETGGHVFLKLESIGQTHRLQNSADFVTRWNGTAGEYEGAFAFFFVDEHARPCSKCSQCAGEPCKGSPNFVGTGTYTSAATDLVVPGTGKPIVVSRNYYSTPGLEGAHGKGWRSSAETGLGWVYSHSYGKTLDVTMPDGFVHKFTVDPATGQLKPPAGRKDKLVRLPGGTWEMTLEKSRERYLFSKEGRLTAEVDEFGNRILWQYDGSGRLSQIVDDTTGRGVVFSWTTGGRIGSVHDHAGRQVVYGYDPDGTLRTVTDVLSRTWQYDWADGRFGRLLSRVTDPWGRVVTDVTYDEVDRTKTYTEGGEIYTYEYVSAAQARKTSGAGRTWIYTLDADGLITQRSEPGESTTTTYDDDGQVLSRRDGAGVVTEYGYTPEGHVASVTHDRGGTTAVRYDYTYDPSYPEKVATVTPVDPATGQRDPKRQAWRYEYVPAGSPGAGALKRVFKVDAQGANREVAEYSYDIKGRLTWQETPGGARVDYDYDGTGDLQQVTAAANDASGRRPQTGYGHDPVGRVTSVTDPDDRITSYTYDALGRVLTVTLPSVAGRTFTTTYSYDHFDSGSGLLTTHVADPNGRVTKLGYDVHGRLVRSEDALGKATVYAYTGDRLTSITDANGNVTSYRYDTGGRLEKTVFPDLAEESYTYHPDGLLRTKTDRRGVTVTYTYDALKRLTEKLYPGGKKVTYVYEGERLARVEDGTSTPAETHVFGYDEEGRVTSVAQGTRGTVTYTYDAEDRVETQGIGGGPTATYGYNPDGSLRTIGWSPVAGSFAWTYTASGQYQALSFPNGQARNYTYDAQGRLTHIENVMGPATLARYGYGYDVDPQTGQPTQLGQRTSQTTTLPHAGLTDPVTTTYGYDALYQLTGAQYPAPAPFNGEQDAWTYDDIGNRLTATVNAQTKTYAYAKNGANPKNGQRLTNDGESSYTYDANGNAETRTQGPLAYGFGYDNENRLVQVTGSEAATYTYDYQGRRTSKTIAGTTTTYLYDGLNLVAETTAGQTSYFLNGPGIDEPLAMSKAGSLSYFSVDGLGSVVATNDPSGTVTHSVVFDAWGNVKAENGTRTHPFTYTGREVGEAGLHFYRARYYQPGIGRFTQEDPLDLAPTVHPYRYPSNSPTIYLDPLGLWDWVRDGLEPLSDFSAGFGDSLTFGGTRKIRQMMGIDGVVNHCSPAYKTGEYTEVATEIALTGGSAALRRAAANTSRVAVRNAFKRATRSIARNGGKMHHVNPLFGHPGGTRALFPTAGLPSGLAHHRLNLALLGAAEHTAAHRRLRALERLAATAVNPGTTTGRAARNSSDDCGCP